MLENVLEGIKVIDLTQNVAGPFGTQILADLGATVIKIERPTTGDDTREWRKPSIGGNSSTFVSLNRTKSSVCIDLSTSEGCAVVKDLVRSADVFIHSMKPGSAEKRGLGHADLSPGQEGLVYCSISAFGSEGPMRSLPGYDPLLQAFTGIMSSTGHEGDEPVRAGVSLIDMGTGLWSTLGIVCALLQRMRTGKGMQVEASLMDTGISWMTIVIAGYLASGTLPDKQGSGMAMTAPYETFRTRDGHVFIAAANDRLFRRVCDGLGIGQLADDARFASNVNRIDHRKALHEAIEAVTREQQAADIVEALRKAGAPCSELNNVAQLVSHPQVAATGILSALKLDDGQDFQTVGLPLRSGKARGRTATSSPALGADTVRVLTEIGYTAEKIDFLNNAGAIACPVTGRS